jgi:hypothetical protein
VALVVPALERVSNKPSSLDALKHNSSYLPRTMDELRRCMQAMECIVFQSNNNWEGHSSTRTHEWLDGSKLRRIECFDSMRYEPYVVVRFCPNDKKQLVAPWYDERFHGYGKNKIEYISHLRWMGYQFAVLPHGFIVHNPHVESQAKKVWEDDSKSLHAEMDRLYPRFLQELDKMYGHHRNMVPQCKEPK